MFAYTGSNRFGESKHPKINKFNRPSPGDYEYSYYEEERLPVSGAVFMSETEREVFRAQKKPPGPAFYNAPKVSKTKSFHLNAGKWVN